MSAGADFSALRQRLTDLFAYDPDNGTFTRRVKTGGAIRKPTVKRYRFVCIDGKVYGAHRMAWLYMTGDLPEEVDHIDRDVSNCRFNNLRAATHAQNMCNSVHRAGQTGLRGVTIVGTKFRAAFSHGNKRLHIGYFETADEAFEAVAKRMAEVRGQFANIEAINV